MKLTNRKVKGFTLVELVTVVAIIAALLGVFAPAMSTYYWKSRVKSANADAKMVYNAVQTEVQKYIAYDRCNPSKSSLLNGYYMIAYSPAGGTQICAVDSASLKNLGAVDFSVAANVPLSDAVTRIVSSVNQVVDSADTKCWAVYVDNYIVKACIAADMATTPFVGQYSSGKIGVPSNRPTTRYTDWLSSSSDKNTANSLANLANKY